MVKEISHWLKEGKQSKITPRINSIIKSFEGDDFNKTIKTLDWMEKNIKPEKDYKKVISIFATRTANKIIQDKFSTGCHDDALILVTFLRALNIPSKYLVGINKLNPDNQGHCVVESYIKNKWMLIEPTAKIIYLKPSRSEFYKNNYIISEGLDSWDNGIKTFTDWKRKSQKVINYIKIINQ